MSTNLTCPQCLSPLPPDAPAGLCPQCLLRSAAGLGGKQTGAPAVDFPDIGDLADVARRLPQFDVIELIGRGGMGVVYKARQVHLDRVIALKILPPADALSPDFLERFRREARSLAKLSHPNIVSIHDFGESGGLYFFAMEFVDGVNLREMLRSHRMSAEEALSVVPKICDALQYAHEEGVVHRDIKPENILVDKRGRLKIADFGLAKLLRREQTNQTLTVSGMALGTPRYMAPEQLDKPESVDHRADIYSLGVVFYEMLTGEVPMGHFAPPSHKVQVDVKLDEIVLRSLERDVERRYQHASEVKTAVERVNQPSAVPVGNTPPIAKTGDDAMRAPAEALLCLAGCAVVTLAATLLWSPNKGGGMLYFSIRAPAPSWAQMICGLAVHPILVGAAGWLMRKPAKRIAVLLCLIVGGVFIPVVLGSLCIISGAINRSWPALIPMWLGVFVCVWAAMIFYRKTTPAGT